MKRLLKILCVTMLISLLNTVSYASGNDLYKGMDMVNYDEVVTGNTIKEPDGSVTLSGAGTTLLYKNIEFYKDITHMDISYSNLSFFAPRVIELRADSPDGTLIATHNLKEARSYQHIITDRIEVNCNLTGIHDVYLIDVNGNAGHIFTFKAYGRWQEAEYATVTDSSFNRKQMLLNSLGAITEVIDDEKLDTYISREDYARAVVKAMKLYTIESNVYDFVDEKDGEIAYLNSLYEKGLVKETGGYIRPKDCVALADAVETYIQLSGYSIMLDVDDPTRDSLLKIGTQLGLLKNIKTPTNRYMTYRDMINLTYDVLMLDAVKIEFYPEKRINFNKDLTILEDLHNVKRSQGVITANEYTALSTPASYAEKGSVKIDNISYYTQNSDAENYLGYNVRFYYSVNDDDERTLLYIYDIEALNEIEVIDCSDIENFDNNVLTYVNKKDKIVSDKIATTADVIYNGVSCSDYTKEDFDIKEGSITLLDNNKDGKWDVISILSAQVHIVDAVDGQNDIVYPKSGKDFYSDANTLTRIAFNDEVDYSKLYLDGIRVNVGELKQGYVISVYDSKPVGGNVRLRIAKASSMVVNDYIVSMSKEGYKFSSSDFVEGAYNCLQSPDMRIYYQVHLTDSGKIAWFENDPTSRSFSYGYVTKVYLGDDNEGEYTVYIRLLDEDSKFSTFTTAEKCMVNGIKTENPDATYEQIVKGEETGTFTPTIIRYAQNSKGEIKMIDTTYFSPKEEEGKDLTLTLKHNQIEYRNQTDYYWGVAPVDDRTVLFSVPYEYEDRANAQSYSETEFMTYKNARTFQGINKATEGFDGSHVKPMGALIKYKNTSGAMTEFTRYIYVTEVSETLNKNDMPVTLLKGISNGDLVEIMLSESVENECGDYIKKGDVWLYNKGPNNDIAWMILVWSKNGMPDNEISGVYEEKFDLCKAAISYGSLYMSCADEILDKNGEYISASVCGTPFGYTLYNSEIALYDVKTKKLTDITPDQIAKDTQTDKEQYAFIYGFSNMVRYVLIINE